MEEGVNYIHGTPARKGLEAELVLDFINSSLPIPPKGLTRTVFVEPNLGNSIPDIVVIFWDQGIAKKWPDSRWLLKKIDYKLIQYLFCKGSESDDVLSKFFPRELSKSLERLYKAAVIVKSDNGWELGPFDELFAVKRIISFEAKITTSKRVIEQALINSTFSSESYVVTKSEYPRDNARSSAERLGIGLWSVPRMWNTPLLEAKIYPLPQSYQSWLLNDLAWEYSSGEIDGYKC